MSHREQIAPVAHQKWANERIAHFFIKSIILSLFAKLFVKNERFAQKTDDKIPNPDLKLKGFTIRLLWLDGWKKQKITISASRRDNLKSIPLCLEKSAFAL